MKAFYNIDDNLFSAGMSFIGQYWHLMKKFGIV